MKMRHQLIALGATIAVIITVTFVVAVGTTITGCVSVGGTNRIDVARVAAIAGAAAQMGTTASLNQDAKNRPYFEVVYNALGALDHAENYDPAQFAAALQTLPVRELRGPNGSLYIIAAVFLWDELAQQSYQLDNRVWVAPILKSVRAGIARALGITPGTKTRGYIP